MDNASQKKNEDILDDVSFEEEAESVGDESELARATRKSARQKKELDVCLAERQEYLDGWQRTRADMQNVRKQFEHERRDLVALVEQEFALDLIKVLDSFDMAFANREAWEKIESNWRTGVEYIYQQLLSTLETHGITAFSPQNEIFSPEAHDSVSIETVSDPAQEGIVLRVLQKGYRYQQKVIRPAKVVVGHYEN